MSARVPTYRRHKSSGQAIVTLTDGLGNRRDVLLGKYGTAASRHEYARVISEWEATGQQLPQPAEQSDLTVNELILAFWKWAKGTYRKPEGTPSRELQNIGMPCALSKSCTAILQPGSSARVPSKPFSNG